MSDVAFTKVRLSRIRKYEHSPRVHSKKQIDLAKRLLETHGQIAPLIVDEDNVIIDGHLIYEALRLINCVEVSVAVVQGRDKAQLAALRLSLNKLPEMTAWDNGKLKRELEYLISHSYDMELTGFTTPEIDMVLSLGEQSEDSIEEVAAAALDPEKFSAVRRGDQFRLGHHIVCCGDARDQSLLPRLLAGSSARCVFIDPPYNVPINGHVSGLGRVRHAEFALASGEMTPSEFAEFLAASMAVLSAASVDGAILYICMDFRHISELLLAASTVQLELKNLCVWVKTAPGMGSFYRSQHELVFVLKKGTAPHINNFELGQHGRSRSNVWRYAGVNTFGKDRMELLGAHPTVKPLQMVADALKDVSQRGDIVLDTFLGSGTTLLAAQLTGRRCVGIEIDTGYVEVAVRRWQKMTGRDAILEATGETLDELMARRATEATVANSGGSNA